MAELSIFNEKKMHKKDILHDVYTGKITERQAVKILREKFNESSDIQPMDYLCLSYGELTAISFNGISYKVVAKWRYNGWPNACARCKKPIDPEVDGWRIFRSAKINGKNRRNVMIGWTCCNRIVVNEICKAEKNKK